MYTLSNKIDGKYKMAFCHKDDFHQSIPFDPANSDFQKFKADLAEGVQLQDAEGNVMSGEAVAAFLKSLAEA